MEGGRGSNGGGRQWWGREIGRGAGPLIFLPGWSFSSWVLVFIHSRGHCVPGLSLVSGGSSLSLGDCHCPWALVFVGMVIVCGAGLSFADAVSSSVGAGCLVGVRLLFMSQWWM